MVQGMPAANSGSYVLWISLKYLYKYLLYSLVQYYNITEFHL